MKEYSVWSIIVLRTSAFSKQIVIDGFHLNRLPVGIYSGLLTIFASSYHDLRMGCPLTMTGTDDRANYVMDDWSCKCTKQNVKFPCGSYR